jgi:hypothetical protein
MDDAPERMQQYLSVRRPGVKIKEFLGRGTDGAVWATNEITAIKLCGAERGYFNERDTYLRLAEYDVVNKLEGFWLPKMRGFDDQLLVVEMDLMQTPPYIIDFAKVRIDRPPEFSEEVLQEMERQGLDDFGKNWPDVKSLLAALESFQIYYLDPKPQNIVLGG